VVLRIGVVKLWAIRLGGVGVRVGSEDGQSVVRCGVEGCGFDRGR
jgi:hypothetical protein